MDNSQNLTLFDMDDTNTATEITEEVKTEVKIAQKGSAKNSKKQRIFDLEAVYLNITSGMKVYFGQNGFDEAVVGLSGGLDSALTLKLAVDALGPDKVVGILMPEHGLTSQTNMNHAKELAEYLEVRTYTYPINAPYNTMLNVPWNSKGNALINLKARLRAVTLYHYANSHNALVLGTSNKSEILLGYGTKYGDFAGDIEVIGSIYKTEVKELAKYLSLPTEFIEKVPTAELTENQTDESELGASYKKLDQILKLYDQGVKQKDIKEQIGDQALVKSILQRIKLNKHKSLPPFVIPI